MDKKYFNLPSIVAYVETLVGFIFFIELNIVWFLTIFLPLMAGWGFAKWYLKKEKANVKLINFIAWANVCSWLIPIVGVFTSIFTLEVSEHPAFKKKKYIILGLIAAILSLLQMILAVAWY